MSNVSSQRGHYNIPNEQIQEVLSRLERVRRSGEGWTACCPAHDDQKPSLTVWQGNDGTVAVKCHAECSRNEIMQGLEAKGFTFDQIQSKEGRNTYYVYTDVEGKPVYRVVRTPGKEFWQEKYDDASGEYKQGIKGVKRLLYNLPVVVEGIKQGNPICFVEGEKDVETLRQHGIIATTLSGGAAAAWDESYAQYLKNVRTVIIPDNDESGRKYAEKVAKGLRDYGDVRLLKLPNLKTKGDVTDWLNAGNTIGTLNQLIEGAPTCGRQQCPIVVRPVSEYQVEEVDWLLPGYLAYGSVSILEGPPGVGKSTLYIDWLARLSTGRPMPGQGETEREPVNVLIFNGEDAISMITKPRIKAAGGDENRIFVFDSSESQKHPQLPECAGDLEQIILNHKARVLVIDPLFNFTGGVDTYKDDSVRRALRPLQTIAQKHQVCIIIVRHLKKGLSDDPMHAGGGSMGIIAAARTAMRLDKNPEEETTLILASLKANAIRKPASWALRLVDSGEHAARVEWIGESTLTANDFNMRRSDPGRRPAIEFLKEHLTGNAGVTASDLKEMAQERGIEVRTLQRAANTLGIKYKKDFGGKSIWVLPDAVRERCLPVSDLEPSQLRQTSYNGAVDRKKSEKTPETVKKVQETADFPIAPRCPEGARIVPTAPTAPGIGNGQLSLIPSGDGCASRPPKIVHN